MQDTENYIVPETHPSFKLNGYSYTNEELRMASYGFSKNGEVYEQEVGKFLMEWLSNSAYIEVHTSGSTGVPKMIKLGKQKMVTSALATGKFFKVLEGTTALLCLSANYIAGQMMLVRAMVLGWRLDIVPHRSNPLDTVYKRYDFCAMVPLQLDNSLNRLHLIKKMIVGGGTVSKHLKRLVQQSKTKVYETYGMTETVSHIAARRLNPKKKNKKDPTFFKALPNISLGIDNRGCLIIKAPKLVNADLVTNDVVELYTYKKFIWKGRYDNVINSGGIKLNPEVIENKIQTLLSQRFFVAGMKDDVLGEKLILLVEDVYDTNSDTLKKSMRQLPSLTKYEIPKEIYFLPKFTETPTGKIQRQQTLALIGIMKE